MRKKNLNFFSLIFLTGILVTGCPNINSGEGMANRKNENVSDICMLSIASDQDGDYFSWALSTYKSLEIAGDVTWIAGGAAEIRVPRGRHITVTGSLTLLNGGRLVVESADSFRGAGTINPGTAAIIAEPAFINRWTPRAAYNFPVQANIPVGAGSNGINLSGTIVALAGDIIIGTEPAASHLTADQFAAKDLYVVGNLKTGAIRIDTAIGVSGDVTTDGAIEVTGNGSLSIGGNISGTGAIRGPVTLTGDSTILVPITGSIMAAGHRVTFNTGQMGLTGLTADSVSVDLDKTISSSGDVSIKGELKTAGTGTFAVTGAANLTVGKLNLSNKLTTGSGTVTIGNGVINGEAAIGGKFIFSDDLTFNGSAAITGQFIPNNPNKALLGTGVVTLTDLPNLANPVVIKNSAGVILNNTSPTPITTTTTTIANDIKAANIVLKGNGINGVTIGGTSLIIGPGALVEITRPKASIVAGGKDGKVTITNALLEKGVYSGTAIGLTLPENTGITMTDKGIVDIASKGLLKLESGTAKVTLVNGGKLSVAAAGKIEGPAAGPANVNLFVAATPESGLPLGAATEAKVNGAFTLTTGIAEKIQKNVIIGGIKWIIPAAGTTVNGVAGEVNSGTLGSLIAGAGTTIVISCTK